MAVLVKCKSKLLCLPQYNILIRGGQGTVSDAQAKLLEPLQKQYGLTFKELPTKKPPAVKAGKAK